MHVFMCVCCVFVHVSVNSSVSAVCLCLCVHVWWPGGIIGTARVPSPCPVQGVYGRGPLIIFLLELCNSPWIAVCSRVSVPWPAERF